MRLSVVILVFLPMSSLVVYSAEKNNEAASALELFPEFVQVKDDIKQVEKRLSQINDEIKDGISVLNKGLTFPFKTRLRNFRVNSIHKISSLNFSSALECWVKCAETDGCTSASFQTKGGNCELSRVPSISYDVLEKSVGWDVFSKHTPVVSIQGQGYSLNFAFAKAHCESLGLYIASYEDLHAAFLNGYQMCKCGWVSNGRAYLVMQEEHGACLSSIGVSQCTWQSTWNVYCKLLNYD